MSARHNIERLGEQADSGVVDANDQSSLIFADGLERSLAGDLMIGRDGACGLVIDAKTVSRTHARLYEQNGIWFLEDRGSVNGTRLNGKHVPAHTSVRLRHGDRIEIGPQIFIFSRPGELADEDRTEPELAIDPIDAGSRLSPLQTQVVRVLCEGWLESGSLEQLPSNETIAQRLGTPGASATVKAALRRTYVKAGITNLPPQAKRRALCRVARHRGWI
jgi:pSer/pThr/pTyr-binding forkhead associated (FHA) protein